MGSFAILEQKLSFLKRFYAQTTAPFREIKRKIEAHEDPYIPSSREDEYDEPPFLSEWLEADESLRLQQQLCLNLLQRSLREFLDKTVRQHPKSRPAKKGNWFVNYKKWFLKELAINWDDAGINLDRIEELTLARNCVQHGGEVDHGPSAFVPNSVYDAHALLKTQSAEYHQKFPDAFYVDEHQKALWKSMNYPQPVEIQLTPEKLNTAIDDILAFCGFIDMHLPSGCGSSISGAECGVFRSR